MRNFLRSYFNLGKIGRPTWVKLTSPREVAIEYCLHEMEYYESWGRHNRIHWKIWQNIAIISGILATVLATLPGAVYLNNDIIAGVVRFIPTALTALSATVMGVYNYKGEHIRQGVTHDSLQGELAKFLTSAIPYDHPDPPKNISLFLLSIRAIISGELSAWRNQFRQESSASTQTGESGF